MKISRCSPIGSSPSARTEVGSQLWAKEQGKLIGRRRQMLSDLVAPKSRTAKRSRRGSAGSKGPRPLSWPSSAVGEELTIRRRGEPWSWGSGTGSLLTRQAAASMASPIS